MQINYFGYCCFKLRTSNTSVLIDPFDSKAVGFGMPKTSADIVCVSNNNPAHNDLTRLKEKAFVIDGPGEYEVKGVSILVLPIYTNSEKINKSLIFLFELEGVRVCYLGNLSEMLTEKQLEKLDGVDTLLVKTGDKKEDRLSIEKTIKLINKIEPSIVIPMGYFDKDMSRGVWPDLVLLEDFIKEYGLEEEKKEKLILSKSNLPEETQLVILEK